MKYKRARPTLVSPSAAAGSIWFALNRSENTVEIRIIVVPVEESAHKIRLYVFAGVRCKKIAEFSVKPVVNSRTCGQACPYFDGTYFIIISVCGVPTANGQRYRTVTTH